MEMKKNQEQAVAIPQKAQQPMEKEIMPSKNTVALAVITSLDKITTLAQAFFESGMFPSLKKQAEAIVKIIAGAELGFQPVYSMMALDVVLGRLRLNSQGIAALVKRSGRYDYRVKSHKDTECILVFTDGGQDVFESSFSIADAQRAGLVKSGSGWVMYPKAMLFARALSQGAKIVCPHLMAGAEPLEDFGYEEVNGEVTKEGEPPPSAWRAFWVEAKREAERIQGHPLSEWSVEGYIHSLLGVVSVKDWLAQGKSLEDALEALRGAKSLATPAAEIHGNEANKAPVVEEVVEPEPKAIPPGHYKAVIYIISPEQQVQIGELAKKKGIKTQEGIDEVKFDAGVRVVPIAEMTKDEGDKIIAFLGKKQEAK